MRSRQIQWDKRGNGVSESRPLKAVELFAGIGGFHLGMAAANIQTIWANDSSELAAQVYRSNFGEQSLRLGDITQIDIAEIPSHDILTAGFPCQPFSPAGKKQGIRDCLRGTLFERIIEILDQKQPQYFFLENVKRMLTMESGYHFRVILDALSALDYFIEWRVINTLSFGLPQNRDRIFIFGTRITSPQSYPELLENHSVFLTEADVEAIQVDSQLQSNFTPILSNSSKHPNWGIAYQRKMYAKPIPPLADIQPRKKLRDILQNESEIESQFDFTSDTLERIKQSKAVNRYCNGVEILYNQGGGARLGYTIFGINGITSTLTASTSRHYERYRVGDKYRRLTPVEYARLMGFPDDWCRVARIYDRYALFGNAIAPPCVAWVGNRIGQKNIDLNQRSWQQLTLAF